jgi:hypothetical protein
VRRSAGIDVFHLIDDLRARGVGVTGVQVRQALGIAMGFRTGAIANRIEHIVCSGTRNSTIRKAA